MNVSFTTMNLMASLIIAIKHNHFFYFLTLIVSIPACLMDRDERCQFVQCFYLMNNPVRSSRLVLTFQGYAIDVPITFIVCGLSQFRAGGNIWLRGGRGRVGGGDSSADGPGAPPAGRLESRDVPRSEPALLTGGHVTGAVPAAR